MLRIIDYFESDKKIELNLKKDHWLKAISACEWSAASFLSELLIKNQFHEVLGSPGTLFLLTEREQLVAFCTLTKRDCIDDPSLYPWIGFLYVAPSHRGQRYSEYLLDHAVAVAKRWRYDSVYLATSHGGLYEKYGFSYLKSMPDIYQEVSRVYLKKTGGDV